MKPSTPEFFPLSLHDALPISETDTSTPENLGNVEGADGEDGKSITGVSTADALDPITNEVIGTEITFLDEDNNPVGSPVTVLNGVDGERSKEHTSELQSRGHLVCRLLLEKKKKK